MSMRWSRRDGDESGFTVVEVMVTLLISSIVMGTIFDLLATQTNVERRASSFAENQEALRQAIVIIQRDVRSSEPLRPLATSAEYGLRIDLHVYASIDAPSPTSIRWIVDTAARELRREQLDSTGAVTAVTYRVAGVANTATMPLFGFYMVNDMPYNLTADTPTDIADCTVRIHITLVAAPNAGPAPARLESDAQLRNRRPGGAGCPVAPATP